MKSFLRLSVVVTLLASNQAAFSQARVIALPPGGPNVVASTCSDSYSLPGFRVTNEDISDKKSAAVRYLEECSEHYIVSNFALVNATGAIEANKQLKAYLRHQGIFPQDVVAARLVRGELIVYVKNG